MDTQLNIKDGVITGLIKFFEMGNYELMENYCNEIEIVFSIINTTQIPKSIYFEYLNDIKEEILQVEARKEYEEQKLQKISTTDFNEPSINQVKSSMDVDTDTPSKTSIPSESSSTLIEIFNQLLSEAKQFADTNKEGSIDSYTNPIYSSDFYCIFLIVLMINNHMDSARFLFKRLPQKINKGNMLIFVKLFLSLVLRRRVPDAIDILRKKINGQENLIDYQNLIEEMNKVNRSEDDSEKTQKKSFQTNEKGIEDSNSTSYSRDGYMSVEGIRSDDNKNLNAENKIANSKDDESVLDSEESSDHDMEMDVKEKSSMENTVNTPNDVQDNNHSSNTMEADTNEKNKKDENNTTNKLMEKMNNNTKTDENVLNLEYQDIYHVQFIHELLNCLLQKICERQIHLMEMSYNHIYVDEAAKNLGLSIPDTISYLVQNNGWILEKAGENDTKKMDTLIPKKKSQEKKQETDIHQIENLTNHLIALEESDKIQRIQNIMQL